MNKKRFIKGISVIEYSLVVAVVAVALWGMRVYVKRAVAGRWRQAADTFGYGRQYDTKTDPKYTGPQLNLWGK